MDTNTQLYYRTSAQELANSYALAAATMEKHLLHAFHKCNRILDVGCGTGRDLEILRRAGKDAIGVEPCDELRVVATESLKKAGFSGPDLITNDSLPHLEGINDRSFDGIACSAVLMHLREEDVFDAIFALRRILKPGGVLLLSIPESRDDVDPATRRDGHGRLFTAMPHAKISLLLERVGFSLRETEVLFDSLGRPGVSWRVSVFHLEENTDKPLHLVESILNRDKKDATYKLALFRALAEIAQTQHHLAVFLPDSKVGLPIESIAAKWMLYYWPIFESDVFIEQRTSEKPTGRGGVAIRRPMNGLITHYRQIGGLSGCYADLRSNRFTPEAHALYKGAMANLKRTIWEMPVKHAGGGNYDVLDYDKQQKLVLMDDCLWRELCLTGSWILDATILRWAELTERLSKGRIKASLAIDRLLSIPDPKRNVNVAAGYYLKLPSPVCVWSDKSLSCARFDIDHAMPFSLWRNNDLWNLFPADKAVNNHKSDRLPTYELLKRRRDTIIGYWEGLAQDLGSQFEREAATLLGNDRFETDNWQAKLFSRFVEAFEVTANQRGVERWHFEVVQAGKAKAVSLADPNTSPPALQEVEDASDSGSAIETLPARTVPFFQVRDGAFKTHLPVIGSIAAGEPFQGFETGSLADLQDIDWVEVSPKLAGQRRFVVRVTGDSMEPILAQGDFAVFEYHRTPRKQGQMVLACLPETYEGEPGVQTIKKIYQKGGEWILRAENPSYSDIRIPSVDVKHPILGTYVGKLE